MSIWIYTDADNTLWDTDAVFAQAQLALLDAAEDLAGVPYQGQRLEFVREYDQAIAAQHHSRLRYPPGLLVRALRAGIEGASAEAAARHAMVQRAPPSDAEAKALDVYVQTVAAVPPILPGVRRGLEIAHEHAVPVYVISEGPLDSVRARLKAHQLESLVAGALSATKSQALYVRLKQRAAPHSAVMIGDQPDRDILFAKQGGLRAVLISSRFRPRWVESGDYGQADAVVDDFGAAVNWALTRNELSPSHA